MKKITVLIITSVLIACLSNFKFISAQSYLETEITFLSNPPEIDGVLDQELESLTARKFPVVIKGQDENHDVNLHYRLAYGTDFFYVYVEAEADQMVYRDRAFQNGDGFHMVMALPKQDNAPTDEFYVLACSAVDKKGMEWTRTIFWYYNVDNVFVRTGKDVKLEFKEGEGKISFELFLPWKDIHPYHPWISDQLGFNLCFVKAMGDSQNSYKVLEDELGAENSYRKYLLLRFEEPVHQGETQTYFVIERNNTYPDNILAGTVATVASGQVEEDVVVVLRTGENEYLEHGRTQYQCEAGLTKKEFTINKNPIPAGGYKVSWYSVKNKSKGETFLTSLPSFDPAVMNARVDQLEDRVSPASFTTIKFIVHEIDKDLAEIKPYETCGKQRLSISELNHLIESAADGDDIIAGRRGFIRKAYLSELDTTMLPYMVYLPEDYNPQKQYPLLVYLHGSASDETNLKGARFVIPDGFIALGPNGRGPSNCYTFDNAQSDIAEAITAVIDSYSVDPEKIILSGFSMGGYGVYRTFYETPGKFKALAIFSGHPNIANDWWSEKGIFPDFTKDEYLQVFKDMPIFIFHGKADRNCAFEITEQIIEKLKQYGAQVTFVTEDDKGHEAPGELTIKEYRAWVETIINN